MSTCYPSLRGLCLLGVLSVLVFPLQSSAFFSTEEVAPAQQFQAAHLALEPFVLPATVALATSSPSTTFSLTTTNGSLPAQFIVSAEVVDGPSWCGDLELQYVDSLGTLTTAPLGSFVTAPRVALGTQSLTFVRTAPAISPLAGGSCAVVFTITAWQADRAQSAGGYFDQVTGHLEVVVVPVADVVPVPPSPAPQIVLNEIYPTPLATTTEPLEREWVEVFNAGSLSVDIEGWLIGEENASAVETRHLLSSAHTCADGSKVGFARPWSGASTIIPSGGLVVIEFCAANRLRNGGDVVRLYTTDGELLDQHVFGATDAGKSHARIPDGGTWVDPLPTPGQVNTVTVADLVAEGWTDAEITAVQSVVTDYEMVNTVPSLSSDGGQSDDFSEFVPEIDEVETSEIDELGGEVEGGESESEVVDEEAIDLVEPVEAGDEPEVVEDGPAIVDQLPTAESEPEPADSNSDQVETAEPQPAIVPEDTVDPEDEEA